jgi:hypothetical protein
MPSRYGHPMTRAVARARQSRRAVDAGCAKVGARVLGHLVLIRRGEDRDDKRLRVAGASLHAVKERHQVRVDGKTRARQSRRPRVSAWSAEPLWPPHDARGRARVSRADPRVSCRPDGRRHGPGT